MSSAVARDGAAVDPSDDATGRDADEPRPIEDTRRRPAARLRRVHRVRRAGQPAHRPRAAGRAAAQPDPLARRRVGRRCRARGGPGDDAAAAVDAGHRPHRGPAARSPRRCVDLLNARHHAVGAASTARWAAPATSHRWPTARWRCSARAGCSARTASGWPPPTRCAGRARHRSSSPRRRGWR